ncbi:MAG TPA: methyltransferase domain-containing protein, partial [Candidatus Binatia bacterium]
PTVRLARQNVLATGRQDRVHIVEGDLPVVAPRSEYDLVTAFECIHDMADPLSALRAMKRLAGSTGTILVVDERVGESFSTSRNDVDWMMYGWSILHCLPVGMADKPSAETGTVMRPDTLRVYAQQSGFRGVEILPIENYFFRFYRLIP